MKKHFYHCIAVLFAVTMLTVSAGAISQNTDTSKATSYQSFLCETQNLDESSEASKALTSLNSLLPNKLLCWDWNQSTTSNSLKCWISLLCNKLDLTNPLPTVPDTNVPDTNVPDTDAPDTNVPDTDAPDTNVPDTDVPDTNVPDTDVPDTDVPVVTPPETKPETPEEPTVTQGLSAFESQVVSLVNVERQREGLSPLRANVDVSRVARYKSQDMADKNYFSHTSPTYGSPFDMLKSSGISYRTAGENIAYGYQSPEAVVEGWMNSPGHRANILNASFTELGVGYVASGHYWTQMFIG